MILLPAGNPRMKGTGEDLTSPSIVQV